MTIEEIMKEMHLEPETINKVVNNFQKAGEKYDGMQLAVAMTLLLRLLVKNDSQRQLIDAIADNYEVNTESK